MIKNAINNPSFAVCIFHRESLEGAYIYKVFNGVVDRTRQRFACHDCIKKYKLHKLIVPQQQKENLTRYA